MCELLFGILCLCPSPHPTPNRRILKAHSNHCSRSRPFHLSLLLLLSTTHTQSMILLVNSLIKMTGFLLSYNTSTSRVCLPPSKVTSWPWSRSLTPGRHALTCMVRLSQKHQLNPPIVSHFKSGFPLEYSVEQHSKTMLSQGLL